MQCELETRLTYHMIAWQLYQIRRRIASAANIVLHVASKKRRNGCIYIPYMVVQITILLTFTFLNCATTNPNLWVEFSFSINPFWTTFCKGSCQSRYYRRYVCRHSYGTSKDYIKVAIFFMNSFAVPRSMNFGDRL